MTFGYPENRDSTVGTLRRARVDKIDDSGAQQIMKKLLGLASEKPEDVYRAQGHGLSSYPPAGSEGLFLSLGGRADRLIGLGFEHKDKRIKNLKEGNTVLYDDKGNVVFAKGDNGLSVNAKTGTVEVRSQTDKVTVKPGDGKFVYLGGDGTDGTYDFVMTESGPSINVKARIG